MVSEVVEVGRNVKSIHVGDRVYPYPLIAKGNPKRAGTVGGFSEYVLIPNAELGKQVYAIPDEVTSKTACLIEPFTVGCRAARRFLFLVKMRMPLCLEPEQLVSPQQLPCAILAVSR